MHVKLNAMKNNTSSYLSQVDYNYRGFFITMNNIEFTSFKDISPASVNSGNVTVSMNPRRVMGVFVLRDVFQEKRRWKQIPLSWWDATFSRKEAYNDNVVLVTYILEHYGIYNVRTNEQYVSYNILFVL